MPTSYPSKKKQHAGLRAIINSYKGPVLEQPLLLTALIVGILALQAADLAVPIFMRKFFNLLAASVPGDAAAEQLMIALMYIAGAWIMSWVSSRILNFSIAALEARAMSKLFHATFSKLLGHSHNFFISNFAGSLTHKVTKYVRAFERLFDAVVRDFITMFIYVVGAITVLYIHNHTLGLALLGWSILFVWFQVWVSKKQQPIRVTRTEADTRVTANLSDVIANQATVALFSGKEFEERTFADTVRNWYRATLRSWNTHMLVWTVVSLFVISIETGILWGAIHYWKLGLLTIGDFVLIQAYLFSVFDRLVRISDMLRGVFEAFADAGEMVAILQTQHEVPDHPNARTLTATQGGIVFDHVDFHFNPSRPIFSDLSFQIGAKEKVAFVGPSGAGKSTITKLLLRLYDVRGGTISIDGQNIAEVTQDSLREAIAFVPQEPVLFHRTLMENIRYGSRDRTDEEVIAAAKQAHCHEFIQHLPEGYNTYVGERGVKLSGGERQRVAIARAILKNAPILVLDEATSSLDSESEQLIQDALETLMRGKTVLVIAHRLSTIMKMDRIVVLRDGKVVSQGTHSELLAQQGLYQKLWNIQAGSFASEIPLVEDPSETEKAAEELATPVPLASRTEER